LVLQHVLLPNSYSSQPHKASPMLLLLLLLLNPK
jgi:hypothetical protein